MVTTALTLFITISTLYSITTIVHSTTILFVLAHVGFKLWCMSVCISGYIRSGYTTKWQIWGMLTYIWKTNLVPAPMLRKLVYHWRSDICPSGTLASPRDLTGSERVLSRALGAHKISVGRRIIGVRAACSVHHLHVLRVCFECATLFRTLKWAHSEF